MSDHNVQTSDSEANKNPVTASGDSINEQELN